MKAATSLTDKDLEGGPAIGDSRTFLAPEWVREVARVVQGARKTDAEFKKLATGFSLRLLYLITDIPQELREVYSDSQVVVSVQLDRGTVRKLRIGAEPSEEKSDFTVTSDYGVARKIFTGEMNAATSFINRQFKVEPLRRLYRNPRFAAKSIVTGNAILKIARQVPTTFLPEA